MRFVLFEITSNQRGAFVGGRRAAARVGGRNEHKDAAVLHAFELLAQQLRLWARVPGVRDDLRCRLVIPHEGVVFESDARGNGDAVVMTGTLLATSLSLIVTVALAGESIV